MEPHMKNRNLPVLFFALFLLPPVLFGQATNATFQSTSEPNIFTNDDGAVIEYLGLKKWTAQEVQDSLKRLAPDRPVQACVAVLKNDLGFAESMVLGYLDQKEGSLYTVVTVVEDEENITPIPLPKDEKPPIERWAGDLELDKMRNQNLFLNGLQFFEKTGDRLELDNSSLEKSSFYSDEDIALLEKIHRHITGLDSDEDKKLAEETIEADGNVLNRMLASVILLNFDEGDRYKHLMLNQIRSKNSRLSNLSASVLDIMTRDRETVDWSVSKKTVRAILAGTSLPSLRFVLDILTRTAVSPALAGEILQDNTFLLEERLNAKHDKTRNETLAFVNQISSKELEDAEAALEWLSAFK